MSSNIIILPEDQFRSILKEELSKILSESGYSQKTSISVSNKKHIRGIKGLAEFLNCGLKTAQQLKNSGKIPFTQVNRLVLFDPDKVIEAMNATQKPRKKV